MAKLTFLEFLKYREKLLSLLNDNERDKSEIEKEYIVIQEELLSNDLSDIDAFWWSDIEIACGENYIADFSKTNANIDFSKLPYSDYCNYKSCNISNFPKDRLFNASHFDSKYDNGYSFIHDIIDDADKFKMMNKIFTLKDYNRLSSEQKEEINRLDYKNCFDSKDLFFIDIFGLDKMSEYSNLYPNEYKCVKDVLTKKDLLSQHFYKYDSMIDNIKIFKKEIIERSNNNIDDYTEAFYHYIKKLFNKDSTTELIDLSLLSKDFIDKNSDMILPSEKIPQDLLERYNNRTLTINDIVDFFDIFKTISFVPYLQPEHRSLLSYLFGVVGKNLEKFINDEEAFKYVLCSGKKYIELFTNQIAENVININFDTFLRDFIHKNNQIEIPQQLMNYEPDLFELDSGLKMIVDILGLDNIKMFEKETGYFSHRRYDNSSPMENIKMVENALSRENIVEGLKQQGIDFKDGTLSYDEFKNQFAKFLNYLRSTNVYSDFQDYRCIDGEFREQHKEFFIDKSAPDDVQKLFYRGCRIDDLVHTPEALKYLEEVDLSHTIRAKINMNIAIPATGGEYLVVEKDFIQEYLSKYGKKKLLDLLMKYGYLLDNTSIPNYHNEFDNEEELDKVIRNVLYEKIIKNYPRYNIRYYSKSDLNHEYLKDIPLFVQEHPDLFIDLDGLNIPEPVRIQITNDFYNRTMSFDFVKQYPELVDVLKDKNLGLAFWNSDNSISGLRTNDNKSKDFYKEYSDYDYIKLLGNENFLKLCAKYGRYLSKTANIVGRKIDLKQHPTYEDVDKVLEEVVYENCCTHVVEYSPLDAPEFLKEQHPELFLAEDAPDELKKHFYYSGGDLSTTSDYPFDFYLLKSHKEWTPYLKDKDLFVPLSRNKSIRNSILKAKEKFGDKIIQIGTAKPETITRMLGNNKVDLMYQWWQKTGCKFVPDFVVMNNFKLEEADKFLDSSQQWKRLGKLDNYSSNIDAREAMLKIAYSFGVFDHDQRGIKKTIDLLTGLPKNLSLADTECMNEIDGEILGLFNLPDFKNFTKNKSLDNNELIDYMINFINQAGYINSQLNNANGITYCYMNNICELLLAIKEEQPPIDLNKSLIEQLYKKVVSKKTEEEDKYILIFNNQSYPKTTACIRKLMEEQGEFPLVSPDNIHRYFGGFQMIYDPDFREFFFDNYDLLFSDLDDQDTYLSYLSVLQNRFAEIKAVYSNVHLTLDLAISYISVNQYNNINTGNAKVSRAAGIQKYSQDDFEIIQKIFNYGKQRVSSSIPRIESKESINLPSGSYKYEILRLDDPRAMSIGFESTCCQRLHDAAELCMEHSMLDKNGRVFVVTNEKNELVSQSWVWRNGNVICFDNIEVPNPKMWANGISRGREDDGIRNQFTDDVLNVYKIASQELIKEDEKVLKNLLDNNKITQETYDSYKLNKITIGEGYSNIKGSFVTLSRIKGRLDRPLHFAPPIPLGGYFYTDDSNKQYLLEKNGDINSTNAATLPVHYDTFVEHTDSTMTLFDYENLVQLDVATKPDQSYRDVAIRDFEDNKDCIVSEIARNYCLNPDTTRIIIHPNFAIIYDVNDNNLRIADLLFNTKIDNDEQHFDIENVVAMQMKLALDQISEGKNVNISKLDSFQVDMYNKALSMDEELDNERGVGHAR